jgi:hypothetical protein
MKQFFIQYSLNEIAGLASILGLILTIFVFFNVRNIQNYYKKRIRLPQLLSKIGLNTNNITEYLNDYSGNINSILVELGKTESNLKTLNKNCNQNIKSECNRVIKNIKRTTIKDVTEEKIRSIHVSLHKIIESTINFQEDLNWEK